MESRKDFVIDDDETYFYSYWNYFLLQKTVAQKRTEKLKDQSLGKDGVGSRKGLNG